ncbi:MAG: dihydropteroate synthase, partial [Bacteroidales bacterium]|nr:dihydropteroate synthase [Bacteroidales bacterium]
MGEQLHFFINLNGVLTDISTPQVMGILNVTPDSFYAASRQQTDEAIAARVRQILDEGATMIDVGA